MPCRWFTSLMLLGCALLMGAQRVGAVMLSPEKIASGVRGVMLTSCALSNDDAALETQRVAGAVATEVVLGRSEWLSKDPIGERGGINLYGFCGNNAVNDWDYLGRESGLDKLERDRDAAQKKPNFNPPIDLSAADIQNDVCVDSSTELKKAADYYGYWFALAALKTSEDSMALINGVWRLNEYGGSVCVKCLEGQKWKIHYKWPLSSGSGDDMPAYATQCPKGYTVLASFHSHPSTNSWADPISDQDRLPYTDPAFYRSRLPQSDDLSRYPSDKNPSFISGRFHGPNKAATVMKLPGLSNELTSSPPKPNTMKCN